jgi:hypothetical protein
VPVPCGAQEAALLACAKDHPSLPSASSAAPGNVQAACASAMAAYVACGDELLFRMMHPGEAALGLGSGSATSNKRRKDGKPLS